MAKAILTAKVAIVRFGKIEIEGLLFEDGSLGVAIPQLARLDFVPPKSKNRYQLQSCQSEFDFERLMKNRFGDGVQLDLF